MQARRCSFAFQVIRLLLVQLTAGVDSYGSMERELEWNARSIVELSEIASNELQPEYARWQATVELAKRKDPTTKVLLIQLLNDRSQLVRGSVAWALSQIGGEDAQNALLDFLGRSWASKDGADLARATEALRELPDKRATDLLIKCLQVEVGEGSYAHIKQYAAEALGKIGDPSSSIYLAQQLDADSDYTTSRDCDYLDAIRKTKGAKATPALLDYLDRLVQKMAGLNLDHCSPGLGPHVARSRATSGGTHLR